MFATWSTSLLFMIIVAATAATVIDNRTTARFQRENAKSLPTFTKASLMVLLVNNLPANAGDIKGAGSIPRSGRSPGGEHGNPLQYACLGNPMDTGAWWATVDGLAELDMTEVT